MAKNKTPHHAKHNPRFNKNKHAHSKSSSLKMAKPMMKKEEHKKSHSTHHHQKEMGFFGKILQFFGCGSCDSKK